MKYRKWNIHPPQPEAAEVLREAGYSPLLSDVLASRGIDTAHGAGRAIAIPANISSKDDLKALVEGATQAFGPIDATDWNRLKNDVRESVQRYIFDTIKRNPMILPIIVEI